MSTVPESAVVKEPKTWRLILTLAVAGLFSGLAIVGAYELTLPAIEAHKAAAIRRAVFKVVPGSEQLQRLVWQDGTFVPKAEVVAGEQAIYGGYAADGRFVGYAVPNEGAGFQDVIRLIYGYDPDRKRVVGMEILESRETPGLGDKIYKDQAFVSNFSDLSVDPEIVVVKGAAGSANEVTAITGATISSKAVVKIINSGNVLWVPRFPRPGEEPPLAPVEEAPADEAVTTTGRSPDLAASRRGGER